MRRHLIKRVLRQAAYYKDKRENISEPEVFKLRFTDQDYADQAGTAQVQSSQAR